MRRSIWVLVMLAACTAPDERIAKNELRLADLPYCVVVDDRVRCKRDCTIEIPGPKNRPFDETYACAWECDMSADATMADVKALEIW